jgi:LysM domain-containing protein
MNSRTKTASFSLLFVLYTAAWICSLSSFALSEPYTVKKGDSLSSIARKYHVTLMDLRAANNLSAGATTIHPGQVLVIPEQAVAMAGVAPVITSSSTAPKPPHDSAKMEALRTGLESGWVVTRNSEGTIFVHRSDSGGILHDLKYLIKESDNGDTWTVYTPVLTMDGRHQYGRKIGVMDKPGDVMVGECSCL